MSQMQFSDSVSFLMNGASDDDEDENENEMLRVQEVVNMFEAQVRAYNTRVDTTIVLSESEEEQEHEEIEVEETQLMRNRGRTCEWIGLPSPSHMQHGGYWQS